MIFKSSCPLETQSFFLRHDGRDEARSCGETIVWKSIRIFLITVFGTFELSGFGWKEQIRNIFWKNSYRLEWNLLLRKKQSLNIEMCQKKSNSFYVSDYRNSDARHLIELSPFELSHTTKNFRFQPKSLNQTWYFFKKNWGSSTKKICNC